MRKGGSFIYSWSVSGIAAPDEFYSEFHRHTGGAGQSITVADYRKASGASDIGFLVAPFDGIHGWYFQNQSVSSDRVTLRIAGFYSFHQGSPAVKRESRAAPVPNKIAPGS